jgi:hypothetical protein
MNGRKKTSNALTVGG